MGVSDGAPREREDSKRDPNVSGDSDKDSKVDEGL